MPGPTPKAGFPDEYAAFTGRWVYRGGKSYPASRASLSGDRLTIEFGKANAKAVIRVTARSTYLAFELLSLEGEDINRVDFLRLDLNKVDQ